MSETYLDIKGAGIGGSIGGFTDHLISRALAHDACPATRQNSKEGPATVEQAMAKLDKESLIKIIGLLALAKRGPNDF